MVSRSDLRFDLPMPWSGPFDVEVPTVCGDRYGKLPPPTDGSIGYEIGKDASALERVFEVVEGLEAELNGKADAIQMPREMYRTAVEQYTIWASFPPEAGKAEEAEEEGFTEEITVPLGERSLDTPADFEPAVERTGSVGISRSQTPPTEVTPGEALQRTQVVIEPQSAGSFGVPQIIEVLTPQLGGRGASSEQINAIAVGLWDGVDLTLKALATTPN
jgi:hypothetical protein